MNDFTYFRDDIEKWLDENEKHFRRGSSPQEYAENALKFHNSKQCKDRCECFNPFNQVIKPMLHPDDQPWFMKIARIKFNLESRFTKQYLKNLRLLHKCETSGCLVSLNHLYEEYNRPKCMSPRRVIRQRQCAGLIKYLIIKSNYRVEEVIKYDKEDIYANPEVALAYLNLIDVKNYVNALSLLESGIDSGNLLNNIKHTEDDDMYMDLPF